MRAVAAAVALTLLAGLAGATAGQERWNTYRHPDHPFLIQYPADWTRLSGEQIALLLVGPRAASTDGVRLTLAVTGGPIGLGQTVESYLPVATRALQARLDTYTELRTDRVRLGESPAVLHYFTWLQRGTQMYGINAAVTAGTRGYIMIGITSARSSRIQDEANLLQKIILTFRTTTS